MALIVKDEEIVGTIDNLEDKLEGKLPITREDLFVLVNSWGRSTDFYTKDSKNKDIYIKGCKATQSEQAFYQNATSNPLLVKKLVRKKIDEDIDSFVADFMKDID